MSDITAAQNALIEAVEHCAKAATSSPDKQMLSAAANQFAAALERLNAAAEMTSGWDQSLVPSSAAQPASSECPCTVKRGGLGACIRFEGCPLDA